MLGAVVPTFNLPGIERLRFTPEALAGIFLGKITQWNDPAIAKENPGVKLPDAPIVPVHRSDGSGTTYVFTDYLSKVSPEWQKAVGKGTAVNWPVGLGGKGNEGVAGLVKQTPNSIGYVELVYAVQNKLPYGDVRNRAGKFVQPTPRQRDRGRRGGRRQHARRLPRVDHRPGRRRTPTRSRASPGCSFRRASPTPRRAPRSRSSSSGCSPTARRSRPRSICAAPRRSSSWSAKPSSRSPWGPTSRRQVSLVGRPPLPPFGPSHGSGYRG